MKKILLLLFIGLVIVVGLAVMRVFQNSENKTAKTTVRIAYNNTSLTNASLIIAYEKKYFEEVGVDPKLVPLKGGKEVAQAISAKQADFGLGGLTNVMPLLEKGAPIRFIAASASSPSYVFVRPDNQVKKFTDLYGKTVSVSALGINDLIFRTAMAAEGIDTSKMKFEDVNRDIQVLALTQQKVVDAVVVSEQDAEGFLKAGAVLMSEWQEKGYSTKAEPRNTVIVDTDYLKDNEKAAEKVLDALIKSHRLMKNNPEEAARVLADHIKKSTDGAVTHSVENIVEQWSTGKTANMIWQDPEITLQLAKKAKEIGSSKKDMVITDIFDLRFKEKLEKAQRDIYE